MSGTTSGHSYSRTGGRVRVEMTVSFLAGLKLPTAESLAIINRAVDEALVRFAQLEAVDDRVFAVVPITE